MLNLVTTSLPIPATAETEPYATDAVTVNPSNYDEKVSLSVEALENGSSTLISDIISDSSIGNDKLKDYVLEQNTSQEGLTTKTEIRNIDYYALAVKQRNPNTTDLDLGRTVLLALGDNESFIDNLPDEKVIEATQYTSMVKTESFFMQSTTGEIIELSEDDYNCGIASQHETETIFTNSPLLAPASYNQTETQNSYLKITSIAYKHKPDYEVAGRNYFVLRGEIEWTNYPFFNDRDVLSIASSGNTDERYSACASGYWVYSADYGHNETAYMNQPSPKIKIYNPGPSNGKGIAAEIKLAAPGIAYTSYLKHAYAYYGISTQNDVTCQVAYAHKTLGLGDISVSVDNSGAISFSSPIATTMDKYYGQAFTLVHESYSVLLGSPSNNATIPYNAQAPEFNWILSIGTPENITLQIDYLNNGSYLSLQISNAHQYTLSDNMWNTIKNGAPFTGDKKEIRWRIKIDYEHYPEEQPYYTTWNTFIISNSPLTSRDPLLTIPGGSRYTEKVVNLGAGGYKEYVVSFAVGGNRVIQTFGANNASQDGYLELYDINGTKLAYNDDSGYERNALLSYNFSANTPYVIRVKYYYSSNYGDIKLAIIPTYSYSSYEDFYYLEDYTRGLTWSFQQNNVKVMTYQFSSTLLRIMRVTSEVDTYLYIIDPRSAAPCVRALPDTLNTDPSLYNDDYDGLNSKIIRRFDENVPYLVIVSAFNPSLSSSVGEFYVDFEE